VVNYVSVSQRRHDADQCVVEKLMLPNAKDGPPGVFQDGLLALIAVSVAADLCLPELAV
jgi:hypothetical protein